MIRSLLLFSLLISLTISGQTKSFKSALKKAYYYEKTEDFLLAKKVLEIAQKDQSIISSEKVFLQHYILFYDYLLSDMQDIKYIDLAIQYLNSIKKRNPFETELLLNLSTSKYHYLASNIGWEASLEVAEKSYGIKDFNQAKLETRTDYLYDLGYLCDKVGNSFEGIKFYKKSLALYIKQFGENDNEVALNYNNLAYAYTNIYNQKNTIAYYEKAAKIWENVYRNKNNDKDYLITVYHNLIFQYINYGDIENAKKNLLKLNNYFFKKYTSIKSIDNERYFLSFSDFSLSNIRMNLALNQKDKALQFLKDFENNQLLPYKKENHSTHLIQCYEEIADYLIENNEYSSALNLIEKGLSLSKKYAQLHFSVTLNTKKGKVYKFQNNLEMALKHYEIAQKNNTKNYFNSSKYTLEYLKSEIYFENNQSKKSVLNIKNTIEQLLFDLSKKKKTIEKIKFSDVKELISTDFINLFYKSGKIYFQNYKKFNNRNDLQIADNLYKISNKLFREYYLKGEYNEELSKYHSEIIEGIFEISLEKKLTFQEKTQLINEIERSASQHLAQEFYKKIKTQNNESNLNLDKIKELEKELHFYKSQTKNNAEKIAIIESNINSLLKKTSKTYQGIDKNSLDNFSVVNVQNTLDSDELVVKYYTLKNYVFALFITRKKIEIKKIASTSVLKKEIKFYLNRIKKIDKNNLVSNNISKFLLPDLNSKKITFIADGFLNYLPFETLFNSKNKKFLVQQSTVSYDYNLSFFLFNKKSNIKVDSDGLIAFAPNYKNKELAKIRSGLSDLRYAKVEANTISNLFDGTSFLNEKASKTNFFKAINQFGVYHFAMHSLLDESNINESCLVFSNNEKLYFSELYGLSFPAKMVVLSACDTGNGNLKSGEGIMSLSRALTYAGVQSSVYSLWQVPDKETSEIIVSFYKNLKEGQPKDKALANAKKQFLANNPMKQHPFYWAGFVVNGDVSPVVSNINWVVCLGIVLVISVLIFLFRKKLLQFRQ